MSSSQPAFYPYTINKPILMYDWGWIKKKKKKIGLRIEIILKKRLNHLKTSPEYTRASVNGK